MGDGEHITIFADQMGDSDYYCPCCGEVFDSDEWNNVGHAGDAWGGQATYECPNDDCNGSISVSY